MGKSAPALSTAALIVVLLFAGCGDSGSGASAGQNSSNTGSTSSNPGSTSSDSGSGSSGSSQETTEAGTSEKAEFIQKGNQICQAAIKKIFTEATPVLVKAEKESKSAVTAAEVRLYSTVTAPALRTEVEEIRALGAPPGDEQQVEAILDAIQELVQISEENPKQMVQNQNAFGPASSLAEGYGLSSCPYGV